jgi:signal transduction histidine kinase
MDSTKEKPLDARSEVKPLPERAETDTSLRAERQKADKELAIAAAALHHDADRIVELARERADDLVELARKEAEATLRKAGEPHDAAKLAEALSSAAEKVDEERAIADARLEADRVREERAAALRMAIEREETDWRLLLERARADHSVASRDDFLAMVSHDVRGLLAGLSMSARVLTKIPLEGEGGERVQLEARRIQRFAARMTRLVGDLLDVVSIESGKFAVTVTEEDAAPLLAETIESFHLTAEPRGIRLTQEVPAGPVVARIDRDRVLQVLANLVGNALKFSPASGVIALRLTASSGGVHFTVEDHGCGVPPDQSEAIFERFTQASHNAQGGLGLGLYISRCIVEAHGGKIWVEPAAMGGSVFHFTLPAAERSRTPD